MINNYDLGNVSAGMYKIAAPSDLDNPYSAENVFGVRIGVEKNLGYYDKKLWDADYRDIPHTTLTTAYTGGDSTIQLVNSRDFPATGGIAIGTASVTYTANAVSTGILTLSSTFTDSFAVGKDVWSSDVSLGLPEKFTYFIDADGTAMIAFDTPIDDDYHDQNIYIDYYRGVSTVDSDGDELDEPEYDMYVHYLAWRIKKKKDPTLKAQNDDDFAQWLAMRNLAVQGERTGQSITFKPDIGHLPLED